MRIRNVEARNDRVLEQTVVTTPSGQTVLVSTIRLPMRLGGTEFETMVFPVDENDEVTDWLELQCRRYGVESVAMEGHADMVNEWYNEPMKALPSTTENA